MAGRAGKHWTDTLFVEHPELFLPWMEEGKVIAPEQVVGLRRILENHGVPEGARILDLASGIGRISINLAKEGYDVVGVDISPLYLELAEKWAAREGVSDRIRFLRMDTRKASSLLKKKGEKFDAVVNIGTATGYYGEEEDVHVFKSLSDVTGPHALLIVETVNLDCLVRHFQAHNVAERDGIVWHENRKLDLETSFMRNNWRFYRKIRGSLRLLADIPVSHRVYSVHDQNHLLDSSGWDHLESYGSLRETSPLTTDSFHMIIVSRKR